MTDIVQALRQGSLSKDDYRWEAADEIERLRAEVKTWINHTKNAVWSDSEECKLLTAEVEKLRSALEAADKLRNGIRAAGVKRTPELYEAVMAFDAARAALEGK